MIAAATWLWAIIGIVVFLALGVLAAVVLGLVELPGELIRRAGQSAAAGRTASGQPLPGEVPDRTPEEAADEADRLSDR